MKATYNQIINAFDTFCTNHLQLNTFYSGDTWDFQTTNSVYPVLILLPQPSRIENGRVVLMFNIFIADILNKDQSNLDEIYSDTLLIMTDLISYFKDNDSYEFYLNETSVTIEPFNEKFDDIVAGWMANIEIEIPNSGSTCGLPMF